MSTKVVSKALDFYICTTTISANMQEGTPGKAIMLPPPPESDWHQAEPFASHHGGTALKSTITQALGIISKHCKGVTFSHS